MLGLLNSLTVFDILRTKIVQELLVYEGGVQILEFLINLALVGRALVVDLTQPGGFVVLILLVSLELGGGPGRLLLDVSKEPEEILGISL